MSLILTHIFALLELKTCLFIQISKWIFLRVGWMLGKILADLRKIKIQGN